MLNKLYIMHEVAMPKQQTTDGFHVMRAFKKRVQEWDCHCPYLWRLCLSFIQNQNIQICDNEWEFVFCDFFVKKRSGQITHFKYGEVRCLGFEPRPLYVLCNVPVN